MRPPSGVAGTSSNDVSVRAEDRMLIEPAYRVVAPDGFLALLFDLELVAEGERVVGNETVRRLGRRAPATDIRQPA